MGGRIFKTIPIETYRGCPYRCTFCNFRCNTIVKEDGEIQEIFKKKDNTERIKRYELVRLYDPAFLYFVDDSFSDQKKKYLNLYV